MSSLYTKSTRTEIIIKFWTIGAVEEEDEASDWLYLVMMDIIGAHNAMVDLQTQLESQPFLRLLPNKHTKARPSEITTANCIVPPLNK